MLGRISDGLHRFSKGWVAAVALVIFLLFSALVLPQQSALAGVHSGGADTPDTSLYYTADDLYQMAGTYGEVGRKAYIRARFTFDLLWPLVYLLFLVTSISWIYARFDPAHRWFRKVNLLPLAGALFDYLENISTSLVMWRYPERTVLVDALAPIFTMLKWVFIGASFLLLVVGFVLGFWRALRRS